MTVTAVLFAEYCEKVWLTSTSLQERIVALESERTNFINVPDRNNYGYIMLLQNSVITIIPFIIDFSATTNVNIVGNVEGAYKVMYTYTPQNHELVEVARTKQQVTYLQESLESK